MITFFHEFGHLLHQLLARDQEWVRFSGASTEWDFIEVPSQLYEEWAWDCEVLQRFAVHSETSETIPEALVNRMRKARVLRAFTGHQQRQNHQRRLSTAVPLRGRSLPVTLSLRRIEISLHGADTGGDLRLGHRRWRIGNAP